MMKYDPELPYAKQLFASLFLIAALYAGSMFLSALIAVCVSLASGFSMGYGWLFEELGTMVATVLVIGFWWVIFTLSMKYYVNCDRKEKK